MKDLLLIIGICAVAAVIGGYLYFYTPQNIQAPYVAPAEATSTTPVTSAEVPTATSVTFTTIDIGTHAANVSVRKNYVAGTEEGLTKLWDLAFGAGASTTPAIDFNTTEVIAVFAGQKPTGGYAIQVAKVVDSADERTIYVTLVKPGKNCMVTEALTNPFAIITLPASSLPLAHKDTTSVRDCS